MELHAVKDAPVDLSDAIVPDTEIGYHFFRLGSIGKRTPREELRESHVPVDYALVAGIGCTDTDDDDVVIFKVPTWSLNGVCIGECYAGSHESFSRSYDWADENSSAQTHTQLSDLVRAHRDNDNDNEEPGDGVPIAPTYTFRPYDPAKLSLGLHGWPRTGISIAVHCVNLLGSSSSASNIVLPAPENLQLDVEANDTPASLREHICDELGKAHYRDGRTSLGLFRPALEGKWKMVLWVMPQIEGRAGMYQYTEGSLRRFLDPEGGKRDGRLYVEAHIVPQGRVRREVR